MAVQHHAAAHHQVVHPQTVLVQHNHTLVAHNTTTGVDGEDNERLSPGYAVLLLYTILILMLVAQTGLVVWRKRHKKSYELVTLVGLWLMPVIFSVQLKFWRFVWVWVIYSSATGYMMWLCMQKKLQSTTPRTVYAYFMAMHRISVMAGVTGYAVTLCEMLGLGPLLQLLLPKDFGMVMVWYGLYFGVLGRDCAEVASDRMASTMGHGGRRLTTSVNNCGICGSELKDMSHMGLPSEKEEACVQLSCKHCFHDLCIKGWTMIGKKDTCPLCLEKVDLRALYADRPWDTRNLTWIQMLDCVRYMVVWNPLMFMVISLFFHIILPNHHHHHHHDAAHALGPGGLNATLPLHPPVLALGGAGGAVH